MRCLANFVTYFRLFSLLVNFILSIDIVRCTRYSKPWLRDRTWKKVEERRQLKLKLESTHSERVKKRIKEQYKGKDQEVKWSACEDKRYWMNEMADIA